MTADRAAGAAVAIVNYSTRAHLVACLESIRAHAPGADVVVVDNASPDGSAQMVRERFPGVRVIANAENVGYGTGANQAMAASDAGMVLLLNADTMLRAGALEGLVAHMERHPRAAIAGPRLLQPDGRTQTSVFPFPGTLDWLLENEPVATVYRRTPVARQRSVGFRASDGARRVPWVLGAALLIRRAAFDAAGGFDGRYFMYFEEVDLSKRLDALGWETHYVPSAEVVHEGGASTRQVHAAMLMRHFQSTLFYYRRHLSRPGYLFWNGLMRLKSAGLLARDAARLLVASEPEARHMLQEQVRVWLARLGPVPSTHGHGPLRASRRVPHGPPGAASDPPAERF